MSTSITSTPQQRLTYEEISQLNQRKDELKDKHQTYLNTHPEISRMLSDFMASVLIDKPDDVFLFASEHFGTFEGDDGGHRPIVLSGPSGVGKSTLVGMLIKAFPDAFGFCVSHTTREPREGEVDGVNYHFTTEEDFKKMVDDKKFLEHAVVHGSSYGTSVKAVSEVRKSGKLCILDIDINGVKLVKETKIAPRYLFITPPSIGELESRLRGRGTETEENLALRLKNATTEIKYGTAVGNFHKVITNDDVEETFSELKDTLLEWFPHLTGLEVEED
jgi:guanylate kinase|tara:strand:+ start:65 stop:892 length:828 start_codon:yes stop_codon:yes gene_type:complete